MNHDAEIAALKEQLAALTEALAPILAEREEQREETERRALQELKYAAEQARVSPDQYKLGYRRDPHGRLTLKGRFVLSEAETAQANGNLVEEANAELAAYRSEGLSPEQIAAGQYWDDSGILRGKFGKRITPGDTMTRTVAANARANEGAEPPHESEKADDESN